MRDMKPELHLFCKGAQLLILFPFLQLLRTEFRLPACTIHGGTAEGCHICIIFLHRSIKGLSFIVDLDICIPDSARERRWRVILHILNETGGVASFMVREGCPTRLHVLRLPRSDSVTGLRDSGSPAQVNRLDP